VAADTGQPSGPQVPPSLPPASTTTPASLASVALLASLASEPASLAPAPVSSGASAGASTVTVPSSPPAASPESTPTTTHPPATQLSSIAHAWPQEPQWAELVSVFTHVPLQRLGASAGQVLTQAKDPSTGAHAPLQAFPQAPQLETFVGSTQPPSHGSQPPSQVPASGSAWESPSPKVESAASAALVPSGPGGVELSTRVASAGAEEPSRPPSTGGATVRSAPASHPLVQSPVL
jgi:hypothetical protein